MQEVTKFLSLAYDPLGRLIQIMSSYKITNQKLTTSPVAPKLIENKSTIFASERE